MSNIVCRLKFIEISVKYAAIFCTIDQLEKKLGDNFEKMGKSEIIEEINFELTRIKKLVMLILTKQAADKEIEEICRVLL